MKKTEGQANPASIPDALSETSSDFLIAEYATLRDEVLKRIELQHQLVSLALIATGTLVTICVQASTTVALAYPILGLFLAAAWSLHNVRVWQMGNYIREEIEENFLDSDQGWEHVRPKGRAVKLGPLPLHGARSIFVGTQVLAVFVTLLISTFPTEDVVLLVLDGMVIMLTIVLLWQPKPRDSRSA